MCDECRQPFEGGVVGADTCGSIAMPRAAAAVKVAGYASTAGFLYESWV
jgi:hypothetical protein